MGTPSLIRDRYLFLFVSFIFWFSHFIYIPTLAPYVQSLGGRYTFTGIVLGSYGLMQLLFRLPLGIFSDLTKLRKPFMIFGMVVSACSCFAFAITDSLGWALAARSLAGLAAATWVAFTALYPTYFASHEVHRAMGSISFIVVLAQLLGMSLSGYIVDEWGWHAPFWIGGAIGIAGLVLSLLIFEKKEEVTKAPIKLGDLISVMREPLLLKISFLSILAHSIIFTTMFGFIPAYALSVGLKTSDISMIVFSFMIPHAIATLFMGKVLVPLLGKWRSLEIAFFLTTCFTLITPFVHTKVLLCVIQGFNGFSLGLLFPLFLGMAVESIPLEKRATAIGGYQALYALGIFGGPFFAGILNSMLGIEAGFYFAGALGLLATALVIIWRKREHAYEVPSLNR